MSSRRKDSSGCADINVTHNNIDSCTASTEESPSTPTSIVYTTNTTTTTTTPARVAGAEDLRRDISSPVTAAILLALLEAGWATSAEIASEVERLIGTRISPRIVLGYLNYYRKKGWVSRGSPYWYLTEEGTRFVKKYERRFRRLIGDYSHLPLSKQSYVYSYKRSQKMIQKKSKEVVSEFSPHTKEYSGVKERINDFIQQISDWLEDSDEEAVLRILLERFFRYGSTYMYLEELVEKLKADPSLTLKLVRRLASKKLVYWIARDGRVGLGRALRQLLGLEE